MIAETETGHLKKFELTISKELLNELPAEKFEGEITVVDTESAIAPAVAALRSCGTIGFDTETRPSFKKGTTHMVSLLQLSTPDICYLFRLNKTGLTQSLISLLEDESITKIGLSTHDDFHNLQKLSALNPGGFIELQSFVKDYHISDNSLTKIYAILFGKRISKGQRLSNWEAETLTAAQQAYAALDAYACIRIHSFLKSGLFNSLTSPYIHFPEETIPSVNEN